MQLERFITVKLLDSKSNFITILASYEQTSHHIALYFCNFYFASLCT